MLLFTGEGPNTCVCMAELPGTSHWSTDALPFVTCPTCGLHFVLDNGEVAIYAGTTVPMELVTP